MSCSALCYTQNKLKLTYVEAYNDISFFIHMYVCVWCYVCVVYVLVNVYMCTHVYIDTGCLSLMILHLLTFEQDHLCPTYELKLNSLARLTGQ